MSAWERDRRVDLVRQFWERLEARDFHAAGDLMHEDFLLEWPQSGERIRGRENFLEVQRNYPGEWHIRLTRVLVDGEHLVSEVRVDFPDRTATGITFFELRNGRISRAVEYWPDPFEPAEWRKAWVEPNAGRS
jgi:ketosteroid isomerase-like protein